MAGGGVHGGGWRGGVVGEGMGGKLVVHSLH